MSSASKRRRIDQGLLRVGESTQTRRISSEAARKDNVMTLVKSLEVPNIHTGGIHLKIQQAKKHAVAQAQQEGCTGSFKSFDSPFGNFLVPVIPTRADLTG